MAIVQPPPAAAGAPVVVLETSAGSIELELDPDKAPHTVEDFLHYVKSGFYDGTVFHRVIRGYVVQGGGYTSELQAKKPGSPVASEADNGLKNLRGTVAMARLRGKPDSATSQFYINLADNPGLDAPRPDGTGETVFGKVTGGMDVVDQIAESRTHEVDRLKDVPEEPVIITSARLKGPGSPAAGGTSLHSPRGNDPAPR